MVLKNKTKTTATKKVVSKPVEKTETKIRKPLGVKIIATYYIIASAITILIGLIASIFSKTLSTMTVNFGPDFPATTVNDPRLVLIVGLIMLISGIITLILGYNLWKMRKWARYVIMFLAILGFIVALIGLINGEFSNIVGLLINGFIAGYLIFSKEAKLAFK